MDPIAGRFQPTSCMFETPAKEPTNAFPSWKHINNVRMPALCVPQVKRQVEDELAQAEWAAWLSCVMTTAQFNNLNWQLKSHILEIGMFKGSHMERNIQVGALLKQPCFKQPDWNLLEEHPALVTNNVRFWTEQNNGLNSRNAGSAEVQ